MNILGISCFYHDAAACLVQEGFLVAAASEERFTRKKHDAGFPHHAIAFCLKQGNIRIEEIDYVVFYDKPFLKFERLLETYLSFAPKGLPSFLKAMPVWLKQKLWLPDLIKKNLDWEGKVLFPEHHESHAASAFFPSPFQEAAILTIDGVGEWTTTSYGVGTGNSIELLATLQFPHSLGLLYSAFTYFMGFQVNSGEYKLMGLAPYGEPVYASLIREKLIDVKPDGSFKLNMEYFTYPYGLRMTGKKFETLFGGKARTPESPITQKEMNLAASIQQVTEEVVLKMVHHLHQETGQQNLCLAGGVALNCVANGSVLRESPFNNVWIQPASGDAGGALGAALIAWHMYLEKPRSQTKGDKQQGSYLGPSFSEEEIKTFLETHAIPFEYLDEETLLDEIASLLADQKVVGWFQGRMEFGPRALGNRSILADPRGTEVQRLVNLKIKFRESFRPFAPSVLKEKVSEYFDLDAESPYMLLVAQVKDAVVKGSGFERLKHITSAIPAVTHVDGSARVQTVSETMNRRYYRLLKAFEAKTGCAVLVNTSFNVRGEPIVCTPQEAYQCFIRTHMDVLVLNNFMIKKSMLPDADKMVFSAEEISAAYGLD